ncbi:hypothetical protein E2562_005253 [Oryza meyeriana var. granulata]|uniref:Uncharacterized protein n=1 Tax=Oryza meyeriana var. granulata TaxID=110450 RepID=A0A6G1EF35_9ORYZ|nr:hypothetical protein E2562_005253 [Oryza meyeriana var. granulata]
MDTLGGYNEHLCKMMSCLRYPIAPVYYAKKFEFGDRDKWEASVRIQPRIATEPEYLFRSRYCHDSMESTVQDAAHEAFLRLHAQHREELKRTEFTHHPYRGEDDTFCTIRDTPCCFNPMVTCLARLAKAAADCYEVALLEPSE